MVHIPENNNKQRKIHLIGIGGIGMSGLAHLLLGANFKISGSDIKTNSSIEKLKDKGAKINIGHSEKNVGFDTDTVVYSSSISRDNPELIISQTRGLAILPRAQMLNSLMQEKIGIAVTGAHGKTTTTAMITTLLTHAGLDPSYMVGAEIDLLGNSAASGKGKYFVVEADESDGSFLFFKPKYVIVTNIDYEHIDHYQNMKELIVACANFLNNAHKDGCAFLCFDDVYIKTLIKEYNYNRRCVTYGLNSYCDIMAGNIEMHGKYSSFEGVYRGKSLGEFKLQIPGKHNIVNSLSAIALSMELGIELSVVRETLAAFTGAKRRFQIKNETHNIIIVDDYAHHPTEIAATIRAAKHFETKRIIVVFQPHRYSRTKLLKGQFGSCFQGADYLIITDLYSAEEQPIPGISAMSIYDEVRLTGFANAVYLAKNDICTYLGKMLKAGDMIIFAGAGDINCLSDELVERIKEKYECSV
ncbi:MAG: UDP-N-acetylmuramate--L-alanine ligase [Candidatus Omnitrophota bacterium]